MKKKTQCLEFVNFELNLNFLIIIKTLKTLKIIVKIHLKSLNYKIIKIENFRKLNFNAKNK